MPMITLKPGDRVTNPLLVGEWEYCYLNPDETLARVNNGDVFAWVPPSTLTLVAPPLPPEPPVGSVVFVDGKVIYRYADGWCESLNCSPVGQWLEFADRFVPAVPKPTVEQMTAALTSTWVGAANAAALAEVVIAHLWPEEEEW